MAESVFLVRSFSQPSQISSLEPNEAIPHRVLTESVSFGRFASESLQWEKWSAFTQNRYLEEVERFTKPGSVAEKKAFFEAHFKNRAAGRTTKTKKIEEVIVKTSDESNNLIHSQVPLVDPVVPLSSVMDESNGLDVEKLNLNSVAVTEVEEALDEKNSTPLSKERRSSSSVKKACSSKLEPSFAIGLDTSLKKTRKEPPSSSKRSICVSKSRNRLPLEPFRMSISCAPSSKTDKKIVGIPQNGFKSTISAKDAGKIDKKKRSSPSSVHASLNFASSTRQTTKATPKEVARNSTIEETTLLNARNSIFSSENEPTGASKSRKRPFPRTSKEGSKAAKCSTSASSVRLPELPPPNNRPPVDKRKNIGSEVSGRKPNNIEKRQPSSACSEDLSTHCRTRAKSFTVSSPFNFRSDERAEKRKEFFKKLEEKNKKDETVKEQSSCGVKANQNTHLVASVEHKKPHVGDFQTPLISLTSPRFRGNQTPCKVSSVKTTNNRNASMEKLKRCKIHPSQTKKKTQEENLSPNILQN